MASHAEIVKTRSKKAPFRVRYIGANNEVLAVSECLTTRHNANKNIIALLKVFGAKSCFVYDRTAKLGKGQYIMHDYGYQHFVS